MKESILKTLMNSGADANHPASVQRHAQPDLRETQVYQKHLEQEKVQASIEAQERELYLHSVERMDGSGGLDYPANARQMTIRERGLYALSVVRERALNEDNPLFLDSRGRQVFEWATAGLPAEVSKRLHQALSDPSKVNVDDVFDLIDSPMTLDLPSNFKHPEQHKEPRLGWVFGRSKSSGFNNDDLQEYNSGPVDCDMDHVKGLDSDGRAALRAAINGDFKTADKLLKSKRCMEWTDDLVQAIRDGATVTEQTIEFLNRMSKTDRAGKISGASLKDSQWSESSDGDVKQRSNGAPRMDWFKW